jgi:hypothetical protein
MRAREFIRENSDSVTSGDIATAAAPIGGVISRMLKPVTTKYRNAVTNYTLEKTKNVGR